MFIDAYTNNKLLHRFIVKEYNEDHNSRLWTKQDFELREKYCKALFNYYIKNVIPEHIKNAGATFYLVFESGMR